MACVICMHGTQLIMVRSTLLTSFPPCMQCMACQQSQMMSALNAATLNAISLPPPGPVATARHQLELAAATCTCGAAQPTMQSDAAAAADRIVPPPSPSSSASQPGGALALPATSPAPILFPPLALVTCFDPHRGSYLARPAIIVKTERKKKA